MIPVNCSDMEVCVKDSENYISNGDMYLEQCQYHKALQAYENAEKYITNAKELAKLYIKTGVCYLEIFEYAGTGFDDANIYFELAYETAPKDHDIIRAIGTAYLHMRDDIACTYFEKLLDLNMAKEDDRETLFLCYDHLGRFMDAEKLLESIANPQWWFGKIYLKTRNYAKALLFFGKILEKMSVAAEHIPADVFLLCGNCYEHLKNWKKAEDIYTHGLLQYKTGYEQNQFYQALFLLYLRIQDFEKIRISVKKLKTGWFFSSIIDYEIDYVESIYHKKAPNTKKLAGIIKKTKYIYEHDNHHMYPYILFVVGNLCRFYDHNFDEARKFYDMAVSCLNLYLLSVEDLLTQIFLAHMEMAYDEKNQAKIDQYAALFIEQVKKLYYTKEETEALTCFAQNDRNKEILYRYYSCLNDSENAEFYYDSLYDTPFVICKYLIENRLVHL